MIYKKKDVVTLTVRVIRQRHEALDPQDVIDALDGIRQKLAEQGIQGIDFDIVAITPSPRED